MQKRNYVVLAVMIFIIAMLLCPGGYSSVTLSADGSSSSIINGHVISLENYVLTIDDQQVDVPQTANEIKIEMMAERLTVWVDGELFWEPNSE